jgi:hypothetical protein
MSRGTVIGAVSFAFLAVVLVIGTSITGITSEQAPSITTVLGFIGLGISQFLANKHVTESKETTEQLSDDLHNGTMERLVREAIQRIAEDESTALRIEPDNQKGGETDHG